MLDHHIQRAILYRLAFADSLTFSQLKPDTLDNKLFTYHLQKVVKLGYADKLLDGRYSLTALGKQFGTRTLDTQGPLSDAPEAVLLLIVRRQHDSAWLLYRRNSHPLRAQVGFMHCLPNADTTIEQTAHKECLRKTGISGSFTALGGGYFRVYEADGLESFTNFTLLYSEDASGELRQVDSFAEYFWTVEIDLKTDHFVANTKLLLEKYQAKQPFFTEATFGTQPSM